MYNVQRTGCLVLKGWSELQETQELILFSTSTQVEQVYMAMKKRYWQGNTTA